MTACHMSLGSIQITAAFAGAQLHFTLWLQRVAFFCLQKGELEQCAFIQQPEKKGHINKNAQITRSVVSYV